MFFSSSPLYLPTASNKNSLLLNISPELNVKKEDPPILGIEEYLKGLREGVDK